VELYALHEGTGRLVMTEKYESEQARPKHAKSAALAGLRSALEGKLSSGLDAQVLAPAPGRKRRRARCDRSPHAIIGFAGGLKLRLKAPSRRAVIRPLFVRFR
jgi:hypothetical protein